MTLRSANEHYTRQARLAALVGRRSLQLWSRVPPDNINAWRTMVPQAAALVAAGQYQAARSADAYVSAALAEQGVDVEPEAAVAPAAFVGRANDGRSLMTLLDEPRVRTLMALADGLDVAQALTRGGKQLQMLSVTQVQDAGRQADSVAIIARPSIGWVRMVNPPCCQRCAILAGKFFRSNTGFQRHPQCDCRHIPAPEDAPKDIGTDPGTLFASGRVNGLRKAEAQAIADGADFAQVINTRRGRFSGMTTTEGATRRPGARLTPDGIYRQAGTREEALELLEANGYIIKGRVPSVPEPVGIPDGFTIDVDDSRMRHGRQTPDGFVYDPDRAALHDSYIAKQTDGAISVEVPEFRVMGGGPASGKSSVIRSGDVTLPDGHVLVNADDAKEMIPEYVAGAKVANVRAAEFVHEESSDMAKRLTSESLRSGYNTVLDGVGNGSLEALAGKIAKARANGAQRIVGDYVTVDTDEAVRRAIARGKKSGRHVPETVIRETHATVSDTFRLAADSDLFDELRLFDNNGDTPRLIFERRNGVSRIIDPAAYESFLRKGPGYTPPQLGVSARSAIASSPGKRAQIHEGVEHALDQIEKVHRIPAGMTPVPIKTSSANANYLGVYESSVLDSAPRAIRIKPSGDHHAGTTTHEFGHYLDHQANLVGQNERVSAAGSFVRSGSGTRAAFGTSPVGRQDPLMQAFFDAVDASPTKRALVEARQDRSLTRHGREHAQYLDTKVEVWARAYHQWIATRSGSERMLGEIIRTRAKGGTSLLSQWGDDEFGPIAEALDAIFRNKGLLR